MDKYTTEVLPADSDLSFPHCIVLKASAGSGKTHALTKRFVQFLLSGRIKNNGLQNVLAITFSNNAAKEMKQRILKWLKELSFSFKDSLEEIASITVVARDTLQKRAERVIDHILQNYSDFNVRTIDSFMTGLFRASSVDLRIDPDFEIIMDESSIFEYTMQKTIRKLGLKEEQSRLIERVIDSIDDSFSAFPWNPVERLLKEVKGLHKKSSFLGVELNTIQNNGVSV
ncbi:MAG: UvrD-helicase domain-containing protein, partial [Nitrospirae bacterium]|nr:UvrD-helicase domain-containing protein [Nitrospirota bacterium]